MSSLRARCERWLWYIFLVSAAWQTRVILWQADAVFIEWRSAALYLSDVLMLGLVVGAFVARRKRFDDTRSVYFVLGALLVSAVFSLLYASQLTVGIAQTIRLAQFVLFFLYLRQYAWHVFDADRSALAFVIGALSQALLGIGQFLLQHDVGLRWIGETILQADMRGVAVFYDLGGTKILRAYGTLPHPNILAAYLMVALWLLAWLWVRHGKSAWSSLVLWQSALGVLLVGQYLTFSRTIIAVEAFSWLIVAGILWWPRISARWPSLMETRRRLRSVIVTVALVTVGFMALAWPLVVARMTISTSDEAVRLRVQYNREALSSGHSSVLRVNWFGVGIGNFTSWLAEYDPTLPTFLVQPAHNIYLMIYSELGLVGLAIWLFFLAMILRILWYTRQDQPLMRAGLGILVLAMCTIGLLDHFYWTLQQGRILWWATLALAAGRA